MTNLLDGPRSGIDKLIDDILLKPVRGWSPRRKALFLLVIAIIVYGVMIADTWIADPTASFDIDIYRASDKGLEVETCP